MGMCYITEFTKKYSLKILNLTPRAIKKNWKKSQGVKLNERPGHSINSHVTNL
jgi:hypothetical protein